MAGVLQQLLGLPGVRRAARGASDWVDLQLSFIMTDLKAVAPMAHGRMLDVGCGNKPYESLFRPYVAEYIGVEHEAVFSQTEASRHGGTIVTYDGRTLPFGDATFDTVLNVQVLEHTPDPQRLVDEMARVLRPRGLAIINAPFSFRLHEEPHDYFRYSPHGLRQMLERAGLDAVDVHQQGGLFAVVAHKLSCFFAFRVGRLGGLSQSMGKMAHEKPTSVGPRYWTLPAVLPTIAALSAAARVLDRVVPDPTEALSFLVLARKGEVARD
jgi:SAM-dependent methyltransferase